VLVDVVSAVAREFGVSDRSVSASVYGVADRRVSTSDSSSSQPSSDPPPWTQAPPSAPSPPDSSTMVPRLNRTWYLLSVLRLSSVTVSVPPSDSTFSVWTLSSPLPPARRRCLRALASSFFRRRALCSRILPDLRSPTYRREFHDLLLPPPRSPCRSSLSMVSSSVAL